MKLRCTHNSIRLRLRKSDLETLKQKASISESIRFFHQATLQFTLKTDPQKEELDAQLAENEIVITLPLAMATKWINSNEVGIEENLKLDADESLHILVEKDFPCLDRENEDKSDTFWELAQEKDIENC